jgi:hypothetical protein
LVTKLLEDKIKKNAPPLKLFAAIGSGATLFAHQSLLDQMILFEQAINAPTDISRSWLRNEGEF